MHVLKAQQFLEKGCKGIGWGRESAVAMKIDSIKQATLLLMLLAEKILTESDKAYDSCQQRVLVVYVNPRTHS